MSIDDGYYAFTIVTNVSAQSFIFENEFNLLDLSENRIYTDRDYECQNGIKLSVHLKNTMTYILIVTTVHTYATGEFFLFVHGTNNVTLEHISK